MTSPTICLLCNAASKSSPIQRGGLLVHSCANCGPKYGETDESPATLKTRSVDMAPRIRESRKLQMVWSLSGLMGLGGNLVAIAQRPLGDESAASC